METVRRGAADPEEGRKTPHRAFLQGQNAPVRATRTSRPLARGTGPGALGAEAVLFAEHDMDVAFRHADHVLVLDRGPLIADGAPEAVRADPRVRAVYLGSEDAPPT